nr:hypothetical protein [Tanacetum cinerariifolium]
MIINHEVKQLKQSHIPVVKVHWNSRQRLEFTWVREEVTFGYELLVFDDWLRVLCLLMVDLDFMLSEWACLGLDIRILGTASLTGLTAVTDTGLDLVSTTAGTICFW